MEQEKGSLSEGIKKRIEISKFFTNEINPVISKIVTEAIKNSKFLGNQASNSLFFVAGSNSYQCNKELQTLKLSESEKAAIAPKNYDIFCISSNGEEADQIYLEMFDLIKNIRTILLEQFDGIKINQINPSYFINQNDIFNNKLIRKYCPFQTQNLYQDCYIIPRCRSIDLSTGKNQSRKFKNYADEPLIYFSIIETNISNKTTNDFIKEFINEKCMPLPGFFGLNITGILLFLELIQEQRKKEFDVDNERRNIIKKFYGVKFEEEYRKIINLYKIYFNDRLDYLNKLEGLEKQYEKYFSK
jgi:hypothetical protein